MINDGVGKVYRWDTYAESATFSTYLFYYLRKHEDKYVRFAGVYFGGLLGVFGFFLSLLPFAPILLTHPGVCLSLQSCHSVHAVSLLRCFLSQSLT